MLPVNFRPMLAINQDKVSKQPETIYASEKLDGIRVVFFGGIAYSRSLKPLPNKLIQGLASKYSKELEGADGEVIAGDLYAVDVLQRSTSFCMKADKVDDFHIYLFDRYHPELPWINRFISLTGINIPNVSVHEHFFVRTKGSYEPPTDTPWVDLDVFEHQILERGGEGVMLRDVYAKYKCNRSGKICPELQKVKRFDSTEFKVIGYTQFETNENELLLDERGYAKRSTSKEGKVLLEKLGSLVLELPDGRTFSAGSGFTEEDRIGMWLVKDSLIGLSATIQHFGYSYDGIPLLPVFKSFRHEDDLS